MPKGTDIQQLATKVIVGDKEAEKDLILDLPTRLRGSILRFKPPHDLQKEK